MSRILVSVISTHGDDKGLILPFQLSPTQVVIVPIYTKKNKEKIMKYSKEIKNKLKDLRVEIDKRDYSPGWKFNEWELKGVPFRIEIGEKELKTKSLTLFTRDAGKKENLSIKSISKLKGFGKKFDEELRKKAEKFLKSRIINCKTKEQVKKAMKEGKIARINWCSLDKKGLKCAEHVEKEINAEVRGSLANKREKPTGKCIICNNPAKEVVYVAKSY